MFSFRVMSCILEWSVILLLFAVLELPSLSRSSKQKFNTWWLSNGTMYSSFLTQTYRDWKSSKFETIPNMVNDSEYVHMYMMCRHVDVHTVGDAKG